MSIDSGRRLYLFASFGVSPFILNEDRYPHLSETLREMELKDLILESDASYLQGENGGTALPTVVREIARKLATLHSKTTDQVDDITSETTRQLYRLSTYEVPCTWTLYCIVVYIVIIDVD